MAEPGAFPRDIVVAALREAGVPALADPEDPEAWLTPWRRPGPPEAHWRAVSLARQVIGEEQETFEEWCAKGRQVAAQGGDYAHVSDWLDEWGCP